MTDTKPPPPDDTPLVAPAKPSRSSSAAAPRAKGGIGGRPDGPSDSAAATKRVSSSRPRPEGPKAASHSMADMLIGTVVADRYKLLTRIGEGAMGWVFVAEHVEIGKKVAIKVLRPSLCRLPEAVSRFRREARSATQIGSKHIVDVTDFGITETESVFLVMENLEGEDLSTTLKKQKFLPWKRVAHILDQLCEALQAAHDAGIIHRDVKPANFFRLEHEGDPDFIKILDFGIARLANPQDSIVTQTGVVMGTPDFMAPEQAMGKHVDHRADIYSLGASVYALLTGRPPFEGANEYDVIYKQLNDDPSPPSEVAPVSAEHPRWLDAVILKALRKDPDDRYASMREFGEALSAAVKKASGASQEEPSSAKTSLKTSASPALERSAPDLPMKWIWAAVGLLAAAGLGFTLLAN